MRNFFIVKTLGVCFLCVVFYCFASPECFCDHKIAVWNDGVTGHWNEPANWNIGEVPCNNVTTTYDVKILSGRPFLNVDCSIEKFELTFGRLEGNKMLDIQGQFTWGRNGTIATTTNAYGGIEIVGSDNKSLDKTLNNHGTANFRQGNLVLVLGGSADGIFNNESSGVFNVLENAESMLLSGTFNNRGEFNLIKPGDFEIYSRLNNVQNVNIAAGSRLLLRNHGEHSGQFNGAGELYLKHANASQASHALSGTPAFNIPVLRMERAGIFGELTVSFDGQMIMEESSTIGVKEFNSHGVIEIINGGSKSMTRTFNNYGTVNFRQGMLSIPAAGAVDNGKFFNHPTGVFNVVDSAAYLGSFGYEGEFNNSGRVNFQTASFKNGMPYVQLGGTTNLNGGLLESDRSLNFSGGLLQGHGTIDFLNANSNTLFMAGRLSVGPSIGTLRVDGNLRFEDSGELFVEFDGADPMSLVDFIDVTGQLRLAGKLFGNIIDDANLIDGSEVLTAINAGSLSGHFENVLNGQRIHTLDNFGSFQTSYGGVVFDANRLVFSDFNNEGGALPADLALISSDISFSPLNPAASSNFTINANVKNLGGTQAVDISVKFYIFDPDVAGNLRLLEEKAVDQLGPDQSEVVSIQTSIDVESYYLITVVVDQANIIVETKENNNRASQVLQIGMPPVTNAEMILQSHNISTCRGDSVGLSGQSYYDFNTLPGTQDFPVQGAAVTVKVIDQSQNVVDIFSGNLTDVNGAFRAGVIAPASDGNYVLRIRLFDGTLTKEIDQSLVVSGVCQIVDFERGPGNGGAAPLAGEDVLVTSEGIDFTNENPQLGQEITIFGAVSYFGGASRTNIPVVVNDLFPVAGQLRAFQIGGAEVSFANGQADSPVTISVPWRNTAYGAHVIQIVTAPAFEQPIGNDQATRLIVVGTPVLSLDKRVELLVDADNNQFESPGDTLRYHIDYSNITSSNVQDVRIIDKFDGNFLTTPVNISHGGSTSGTEITWNIGAMASGAVGTVTYDMTIKPLAEKAFVNNFVFMTANDAGGQRLPSAADTHQVEVKVNRAPVANAGQDQQLTQVGVLVPLDGTSSYDPDQDDITFAWTLNIPAGSSAVLNDPTSPTPSFTADVYGVYTASLVVKDEFNLESALDTVEITFDNLAPVADAGENHTMAHPGGEVTLDGSASYDPDNHNPLAYFWEIIDKPVGSVAMLANPNTVNPTLTFNFLGEYKISLVVKDALGKESPADEVIVSTSNSTPVADAGMDKSVEVLGSVIQLDGSQSYDPDGDNILYTWTLVTPPGSWAALDNAHAVSPSFTVDVHDQFKAILVVTDVFGESSPADEVIISFNNLVPVAEAGGNQMVVVGDDVHLDGAASSDVNGDQLFFDWRFVSRPSGSLAAFPDPTVRNPQFVPDQPGDYIVSLVVSDGFASSNPDTLTVKATSVSSAMMEKLAQLTSMINSLPNNAFKNANMKNTLTGNGKLGNVLKKLEQGNHQAAVDKLNDDIILKVDGCAANGGQSPDSDDWIVSCAAQTPVYNCLIQIRNWILMLIN